MATFFVSTTGNDSTGTGTQVNPWKTIAKGVSGLNPGDTLFLRGGTYLEPIHMTRLGSAGNFITVSSFTGETAISQMPPSASWALGNALMQYHKYIGIIFDGTDSTQGTPAGGDQGRSALVIGANSASPDNTHDVIIQNCEVRFMKNVAMFFSCSGNISVINTSVHDTSGQDVIGERNYGMYIAHGSGFLIDGCQIYNNVGGGIQAYPNPQNLTIRNCTIHNNNVFSQSAVGGIIIQQDLTLGPAVVNTQVYNNIIYNNGTPSSGNAYGILVDNVTGAQLYNNTIYGNKSFGIGVGNAVRVATNTIFRNNLLYKNQLGDFFIFANSTGTTTQDHNFNTDPKFVNEASFDFHLQATSAAINSGATIPLVTNDFVGTARPQGSSYDIGAYEFTTGGSLVPLPPTGIMVI